MTNLELTPEELKALEETLTRNISDLAVEVAHTDAHDFKDKLKRRKAVMDHLLEKVQKVAVTA